MLKFNSLACGLTLLASSLAFGQDKVVEKSTVVGPDGNTTEVRKVSQILGSNVNLQNGNNFGKVQDVVIGPDGRVEYAVVAHDNQYLMMPWTAGQYNYGQRVLTYDVTPQAVRPLMFAPTAWPNVYGQPYGNHITTIFGNRAARRIERNAAKPVVTPAPGTVVVPPAGAPVPPPAP